MTFDIQGFSGTKFEPRTEEVEVPALKEWFDKGEKPLWKVRGQTSNEMVKAFESVGKNKTLDSLIKAIGSTKKQIDEIKEAIGVSDQVPEDIIKRLEQIVTCSIDPVIDMPTAVKLAEAFPIEFYTITMKIVELTGLGMNYPKSKPSGKTKQ